MRYVSQRIDSMNDHNDEISNPYFAILREDVMHRARLCRGRGMDKPLTWEYVANHLWTYYLEFRQQWPGENESAPPKRLFYKWVRDSVKAHDASRPALHST